MIVTEIKKVSDKQFDLVINGTVIGSSKTDVDARVHMHFLDKLFEQEFHDSCPWPRKKPR